MIPAAPDVGVRFNPPPAWTVPAGFDPRRGHLTDPAWPTAPEGWSFWVADPVLGRERATLPSATLPRGKLESGERRRVLIALACLVGVGGLVVWGSSISDDEVTTGVGSCWTGGGEWLKPVSCDSSDAAYVVEERVSTPDACPASTPVYLEDRDDILCLRSRG